MFSFENYFCTISLIIFRYNFHKKQTPSFFERFLSQGKSFGLPDEAFIPELDSGSERSESVGWTPGRRPARHLMLHANQHIRNSQRLTDYSGQCLLLVLNQVFNLSWSKIEPNKLFWLTDSRDPQTCKCCNKILFSVKPTSTALLQITQANTIVMITYKWHQISA